MSNPSKALGRPRDDDSRQAILRATFALLLERGYPGLALEVIAKRAGVGKTTIYRWWPKRALLAVEAFFDQTVRELAFPETGRAADDFRAQLHLLAGLLRGPRGEVLLALMVGAKTDPELADAVRELWLKPRQAWGQARLKRAVVEGECVPQLDGRVALDALYSPLYGHLILGLGVHTPDQLDAHCDFLFPAIFRSKRK